MSLRSQLEQLAGHIVSAKNRKSRSRKQDRYPTPNVLVTSFATALVASWRRPPPTSVLEPGAGRAPFLDAVRQAFPTIKRSVAVDIRRQRVGVQHTSIRADFPSWQTRQRFDLVVTNPAFSLAESFMRRSVELLASGGICCFLLRLNYLGSKKRIPLWREIGLRHVSVIVPRPSFTGGGNDATEYAWIFFDGDPDGVPATTSWFHWVPDRARRRRKPKGGKK